MWKHHCVGLREGVTYNLRHNRKNKSQTDVRLRLSTVVFPSCCLAIFYQRQEEFKKKLQNTRRETAESRKLVFVLQLSVALRDYVMFPTNQQLAVLPNGTAPVC